MKKKISVLFCSILFLFILSAPLKASAVNIGEKDFYDSYNTLLSPYASKAIRSKLGADRSYSLTDAKILNIVRLSEGSFDFKVTVQYRTYTGAHNPPESLATIIFKVDASGVKVLDFKNRNI